MSLHWKRTTLIHIVYHEPRDQLKSPTSVFKLILKQHYYPTVLVLWGYSFCVLPKSCRISLSLYHKTSFVNHDWISSSLVWNILYSIWIPKTMEKNRKDWLYLNPQEDWKWLNRKDHLEQRNRNYSLGKMFYFHSKYSTHNSFSCHSLLSDVSRVTTVFGEEFVETFKHDKLPLQDRKSVV